jgi:hypothetical protein
MRADETVFGIFCAASLNELNMEGIRRIIPPALGFQNVGVGNFLKA